MQPQQQGQWNQGGGNDLLMGGGRKTPPCKWGSPGERMPKQPGYIEHGLVCEEPGTMQQSDYQTGKLKFYDDGNPIMQVVIKIQTDRRDPNIKDDDGIRAIYAYGQMLAVIREAIIEAGGSRLDIGTHLYVKYVEQILEPRPGAKPQPKNIWAAKVTLPVPSQADMWGGDMAPQQSAPPQYAQQAPQQYQQQPPQYAPQQTYPQPPQQYQQQPAVQYVQPGNSGSVPGPPPGVNHHGQPQSQQPPDWAVPPTQAQMAQQVGPADQFASQPQIAATNSPDQQSMLARLAGQHARGTALGVLPQGNAVQQFPTEQIPF